MRCRFCKHSFSYEGSKVLMYCRIKHCNRTVNGFKRIGFYEHSCDKFESKNEDTREGAKQI